MGSLGSLVFFVFFSITVTDDSVSDSVRDSVIVGSGKGNGSGGTSTFGFLTRSTFLFSVFTKDSAEMASVKISGTTSGCVFFALDTLLFSVFGCASGLGINSCCEPSVGRDGGVVRTLFSLFNFFTRFLISTGCGISTGFMFFTSLVAFDFCFDEAFLLAGGL